MPLTVLPPRTSPRRNPEAKKPIRLMPFAGKVGHAMSVMVAGIFLGCFAAVAQAQLTSVIQPPVATNSSVTAVLVQSKVVKAANGSEKLEDASKVKPGDVIEYRVTYTNNSDKPVRDLVADLPIPDGLEYQARSAKPGPDRVKVAAADAVFSQEPLMRMVAGKSEPVPYNSYRRIQWTLGQLPAHGVTAVTARARVEEVVPELPKLVNPAQAPKPH